MSSVEPVTLPHTWRPLGVRVAVVFFGSMLVLVCAFAWLGFDPEIRAKFTVFQRSTLLGLGLLYAAVGHALARSRVEASQQGLHVVNGYKSRDYEWAEVVAIHLTAGSPWATIDLADGTTASILALQGSDGERARLAVRQLRGLINR
ncbi:PH domain-containing protein [Nocardioides piscis]|uniref:PH domain-containing protein n=1 Tax=Nocardioides piscis TaxID=2714938 RepID=A0A6G7YHZ3_9ACTN|nr:PH domain-containing protein [Nocardioides piscis]QIK76400.1 PH domain-containing protein [Nocardioides piscis]